MKGQSKKVKPNIFLFHGDDDYSVTKKVEQWKEIFLQKHSASGIIKIDAEQEDNPGQQLLQSLESEGLFASKKLILIRRLFAAAAIKHEQIVKALDNIPSETFLVFSESSTVKKTLKLYKKVATLEKMVQAKIQEFVLPQGAALTRFIERYVKDNNGSISAPACEKLAVLLGRDQAERVKSSSGYTQKQVYNLWQVSAELNKLLTYCQGRQVSPADVELLVVPKISNNIFAFTDALGRKNQKQSLQLLSQLLDTKGKNASELQGSAILLVGAIASQFRSLLIYLETQNSGTHNLAGTLGWSSYRVRAVGMLANFFSTEELKKIIEKLANVDAKLKSSNLPPQVLLTEFTVNITS